MPISSYTEILKKVLWQEHKELYYKALLHEFEDSICSEQQHRGGYQFMCHEVMDELDAILYKKYK